MKKHDFVTLDGMRGLAALAVVTHHCPGLEDLLPVGYLAVDFFFMLSGFVIAHAYERKLRDRMTFFQFLLIRIIRLYPLYLLSLAIAVAGEISQIASDHQIDVTIFLINLGTALFFLPSPTGIGPFPINGPAWSLFFELFANVMFAFAIPRASLRAVATMWIFCVPVFVYGVATVGMDSGWTWQSLWLGFPRAGLEFFAGVFLYSSWAKWNRQIALPSLVPFLGLGAILIVQPEQGFNKIFSLYAVMVLIPSIIILAAWSKPGRHLAAIYSTLGASSYALYVLHVPLFILIFDTFGWASTHSVLASIPIIGLILCISFLSDIYYDIPIRRRLMILYDRFSHDRRVSR
jgi:peptidoglycan/LPS O-acetylase OafA/YrhL